MSTFNIKSTVIANRDNSPKALTDPQLSTGKLSESFGAEQLPQTPAAGSYAKLLTVPSSARLSKLEYCVSALGTSSLDIGVWYPTSVPTGAGVSAASAGVLISSSAFTAAISGGDAGAAWTDGTGTITQNSVVKRSYPLWQALGLSADPMIDFDMGFSVRTANAIAGYVGLRAMFVD